MGESTFCCSFYDGGGRSPFTREYSYERGRGDRNYGQNGRGYRGNRSNYTKLAFKGKCNRCGMINHHAGSCRFFLNLHQSLLYLGVDSETAFKMKKTLPRFQNYNNNRNYVHTLIGIRCTPFTDAGKNNCIDLVNGNHLFFTPGIINSIDGNVKEHKDKELTETSADQRDLTNKPKDTPTAVPRDKKMDCRQV